MVLFGKLGGKEYVQEPVRRGDVDRGTVDHERNERESKGDVTEGRGRRA